MQNDPGGSVASIASSAAELTCASNALEDFGGGRRPLNGAVIVAMNSLK
jgi:hypothetical protein